MTRKARILIDGSPAAILQELEGGRWRVVYDGAYIGPPISLIMPLSSRNYEFEKFPPFFEGLLPEGFGLEALLKKNKIDRHDYFAQLIAVGNDLVGTVTVEEIA